MKDIKNIISSDLCTSCGLCAINNLSVMKMENGIYIPKFFDELSDQYQKEIYDICPGKGYPIVEMGKNLYYNKTVKYDYRLGYYNSYGVATSNHKEFIKKSSSGALIPTIAKYLLDNKLVKGILTVKFIYSNNGPIPEPFIAETTSDLISSQGSKYLPIPLLKNIDQIISYNGNLAVIGLPCQIAGIRLIQNQNKELKNKIKYTISNFCGGYRDYRETERIFELNRVNKSDIKEFFYRGKGQPGFMTIKQNNKKEINLKYPDYTRLTGFTKYHRCKVCVDATAELADISFGDAWLPKFLESGKKWSIYLCRSKEMNSILNDLKNNSLIETETITKNELVKSQYGNLNTKKERQASRYKFYNLIGKKIPLFDGGYRLNKLNIYKEVKIYVIQKILYLFEKVRIYHIIAKLIKRV